MRIKQLAAVLSIATTLALLTACSLTQQQPAKKRVELSNKNIQADGDGYTCTNERSGTKFFTSDLKECEAYTRSYQCELEENWSVNAVDKKDCETKRKEYLAQKDAEFDLETTKENYKGALENLEKQTRP